MKKTLFRTIVMAVFIWPFFHHLMMPYYHIDVWKYFGMAMYAHTVSSVSTSIAAELTDKTQSRVPPHYQKHFDHFNNTLVLHYRYMGDLYDPAATARVLFQAVPPLVAVRVTLRDINLAKTSMTYERRVIYTCRRLTEPPSVHCTRSVQEPVTALPSPQAKSHGSP